MTIYQFVYKASLDDGTEVRNVLHYEFAAYTPSTTELQEAVDALDAAYKTNLQGELADTVAMQSIDVRRVDIGDQPTQEYFFTAGTWSGLGAADQLPAQLAALYVGKAFTAFPRSVRTYLFPMTEGGNSTTGTVGAAVRTNVADWGDDALTLAITGQTDASRVAVEYGGVPRAVIDSNIIESGSGKSKWATLRSRRLGTGI